MRASAASASKIEDEEMATEAAAAGGVSVFPGLGILYARRRRRASLLKLLPRSALFVDEPAMVRNQIDRWWNKVEQRHERTGIGSLIRPEDIYLRPEVLAGAARIAYGSRSRSTRRGRCARRRQHPGRNRSPTRPTLRFHGSIPALTEQLKQSHGRRKAHRSCRA